MIHPVRFWFANAGLSVSGSTVQSDLVPRRLPVLETLTSYPAQLEDHQRRLQRLQEILDKLVALMTCSPLSAQS